MGGISDEQVEWAFVNRLKSLLERPPETRFNVTQTFATFSAILLWTKERAWVGGNYAQRRPWFGAADHAAANARDALNDAAITDAPWYLSTKVPTKGKRFVALTGASPSESINDDFEGMPAADAVKWMRDAIAHGDGRNIRPLHWPNSRDGSTWLAGFRLRNRAERNSITTLEMDLYQGDMMRIGMSLADLFCRSMAGALDYAGMDSATAVQELVA